MEGSINISMLDYSEASKFNTTIKFFESTFTVSHSVDAIWTLMSDIRNAPQWHPYMFPLETANTNTNYLLTVYPELKQVIENPTASKAVFVNNYTKLNQILGVLIMDVEVADYEAKYIKCHAYPIEEDNYTGYNFFELNLTPVDANKTTFKFTRHVNPNLSLVPDYYRSYWYSTLCDIAVDISTSLHSHNFG